jgi:hypothetical protein
VKQSVALARKVNFAEAALPQPYIGLIDTNGKPLGSLGVRIEDDPADFLNDWFFVILGRLARSDGIADKYAPQQ